MTNFLSLAELESRQISDILAVANAFRRNPVGDDLAGKTAVLFFPESSIRTRIAFEQAVYNLGGNSILFPPDALDKKEEIRDVAGYMDNWIDLAVIRHADIEKLRSVARYAGFPVVNAMTSNNHPCEILSDYFGISLIRQDTDKLRYTFVGPAGNILGSWINLAAVMNLKLVHVCRDGERVMPDSANYTFTTDLESVLPESDVILTDPLPPSFQNESYYQSYRITSRHLALLPDGAIVNPCPPFYRGEEISEEVIASPRFVGYGFKKNLLYVHQAIIRYCLVT